MILNPSISRRGGIVVETAIILAVIALLVLIAIPVYRSRPQDSREAQARAEVLALGQALEQTADASGFYVPLQLLDDRKTAEASRTDKTDDLANEPGALKLILRDTAPDAQAASQTALSDASALLDAWKGPYAETKRVYLGASREGFDLSSLSAETIRRDYPLDPWGNPYRFYSPIGIVGSRAAESAPEALDSDEFSDGALTTQDDRFDTYAIVSYGANGESDSASETDDDVIYLFETTQPGAAGEASDSEA